ncbi:hypothetical protein I7I48_06940 [Histoplasma ohiense]|nr:hypothetical protein I7I48_06940 [Histoplasma ohiense (nom. inval.)]
MKGGETVWSIYILSEYGTGAKRIKRFSSKERKYKFCPQNSQFTPSSHFPGPHPFSMISWISCCSVSRMESASALLIRPPWLNIPTSSPLSLIATSTSIPGWGRAYIWLAQGTLPPKR